MIGKFSDTGIANTASAVVVLGLILAISGVFYVMSYIIITYVMLVIALIWLTVIYALAYQYIRVKLQERFFDSDTTTR